MSKFQQFCVACVNCGQITSKAYARSHEGKCKCCVTGVERENRPTREERIIDSGYQAYALEEGHYNTGDY